METFDTLPQLGRFSLRDEGKTIAIGKVTKIISWSVCWTHDVQNGGSLFRKRVYFFFSIFVLCLQSIFVINASNNYVHF